jgi:hypothetical protein
LAKGIRELYMIVSIPWHLGLKTATLWNTITHNLVSFLIISVALKRPVIENVDWSLHWIEFGDVSSDVV